MLQDNWLATPPGQAKGCLPRDTKPGEIAPLLRERMTVIPKADWDAVLRDRADAGLDYRGRKDVKQILNQGRVGSCATESTTQGVMVTAQRAGYPFELLNPWSIYRVTSGGVDRGSNIDRNLEFARDVGILPDSYWPRYDENGHIVNPWRSVPPDGWEEVAAKYRIAEWYDIETEDEVGTALLQGYVVVCGWSGHSEVAVDLLPGQVLDVANSWGIEYGDRGFHHVPVDRIRWSYGAFAVRVIRDRGL